MAGKNLPPRQKMIGMMYLVLTALLALNVSKDILEAFVVVNEGLEANVTGFDQKNERLYADFDLAKSVDPVKVLDPWIKAQDVRGLSEDLAKHIVDLKKELLVETEGIEADVADTIGLDFIQKKDNYDTPTNILIGDSEDGSAGKAHPLRQRIEEYRERLIEILGDTPENRTNVGLNTDDQPGHESGDTWEMINFYHTPLAASVTILTKLENDVKNAEFYTVNHLLEGVTKGKFPIDTVVAKVMPRSNYVLLGEEYEADVFLAAFSTTKSPDIYLGDLDGDGRQLVSKRDSLEVNNGLGKYTVEANKEGLHTVQGMIDYTTAEGEVLHFPFQSEYIVARPSLTVAPTKMNVLYKGIENPISLSVPGVPLENVTASISGGNRLVPQGNGNYIVQMSKGSPRNVEVSVSAKMPNGETMNMGSQKFRVKNLPVPNARVGKIKGSGAMTKQQLLAAGGVRVEYGSDFEFNTKLKNLGFQVYLKRGNRPIDPISPDGRWTSDMRTVINSLRPGETIIFERTRAEGEDGVKHALNTIKIKII